MYVATEAHDDDGLPHTLEHLVFMGSENYPYKVRCTMYIKLTLHISHSFKYPALTSFPSAQQLDDLQPKA